jgi:peptidyl-prolyl cis-trans isomerase A (cyclophilin A)
MARLDDPDSAGAQFYINVRDNPTLDAAPGKPGYTVFGRVVSGMDVVTDIELVETHLVHGMAGVPVQPVVIQKAERIK